MKKLTKDKLTGVLSIVFGLVLLCYLIPNWVVLNDALNHTNPDTFPRFSSYGLILLGIALLIQAYITERKQKGQLEETAGKKEKFSFEGFMTSDGYCIGLTALTVVLFYLLLKPLGYIPTGIICSVFLLVGFRSKKWYHYVIVIAFTLLLYFLFAKVLLVKMP